MPFDEDEKDLDLSNNKSLKKVSSQKSIFDTIQKKPTQDSFEKKVKEVQEQKNAYQNRLSELTEQFIKVLSDKTLKNNKNPFEAEFERELLIKMMQVAIDINADQNEPEGSGSLPWISLLLKVALNQRNKLNELEYALSQLKEKQ